MPDIRGKRLLAGDRVIYNSTHKGVIMGRMKYDENERVSYHINCVDGQTRYFQKSNRHKGSADKFLLNLDRLYDDLVDNPDLF